MKRIGTTPAARVLLLPKPGQEFPPGLDDGRVPLRRFVSIDHTTSQDLSDVEVAFAWNFRSSWLVENIERLPSLKWVHVGAVGVERAVDISFKERGIVVTNSRGVTADSMAEYSLMLMLSLAKKLPSTLDAQANRRWSPRLTSLVRGKTLTLVGLGPVNRALARLVRPFDMRVYGIARRARSGNESISEVATPRAMAKFFSESDFVSVALPNTRHTRGLIDAASLDSLSDRSIFINVGRGAVVDQDALYERLARGAIGAAGLDVFLEDPLPAGSPFWLLSNAIISPHMSADFHEWEAATVDLFIENLARWESGLALKNVIDLDLGYVVE